MSLTTVPLDSAHRFCLYQTAAFNTVVTVQGWFAPSASAPNGLLYTPITPAPERTVDTATRTTCSPNSVCVPAGPVPAGTEVMSTFASHLNPAAAFATFTISDPTASGTLTSGSCSNQTTGTIVRSATTFSANDDATTSMSLVRTFATELGQQFCSKLSQAANETIDVTGIFTPATDGGTAFAPSTPTRVLDTQRCWTDPVTAIEKCNTTVRKGALVRAAAPAGARAVVLHVTGVGAATSAGQLQAAACEVFFAKPTTPPTPAPPAAVQIAPNVTNTNFVVVPVSASGRYCVKTTTPAHIAIDLIGTFSASADLRLLAVKPLKILDTRPRA